MWIKPSFGPALICLFTACFLSACDPQITPERRESASRMAAISATAQNLSDKILNLEGAELADEAVMELLIVTGKIEGMNRSVGGVNFETADITSLLFLLMMQISEDAKEDLRALTEEMERNLKQKQALRDEANKLKEEMGALREALREEYESLTSEQPQESTEFTDYLGAHFSSLFGKNPYDVFGSDSASWLADAAAGDVSAFFICPNTQVSASLSIENAISHAVLASNEGIALSGVSVSTHVDVRTPLRVYATLDAAAGSIISKCSIELRYNKPRPYTPWTPSAFELDQITQLQGSMLTQGQELLTHWDAQVAAGNLTLRQATILGNWALDILNDFGNEGFDSADQILESLKEQKDSLSEMSEQSQLKMQMYMDRMQKADEANSNAMKKFSEVTSQIIGNMK